MISFDHPLVEKIGEEIKNIFKPISDIISIKYKSNEIYDLEIYIYKGDDGASMGPYKINGSFFVNKETKYLASFSLGKLDGGDGLVFSHTNMDISLQGKGYGLKLHKMKLDLACEMSCNHVIATCSKFNEAQIRVFKHFGWCEHYLSKCHLLFCKEIIPFKDNKEYQLLYPKGRFGLYH